MMMKKKKKDGAATPSLKDCANCGAPEGTVPGSPAHSVCSRCKITYYCSVKCQKRHWKQGGHKQHCMTPEQRSASAAAAAAEESSPKRGVAAEEEEGECAISLESLGSGVQILECGHRFHKACVVFHAITTIVPRFSSFNTFDEKYNLYYPAQAPP